MDCGPAALKCLLDGFGIEVSYGRLREACQTAVDGTSIDTLETLGASLGLEIEQVMMPVDHLLLPEADALPAIVVVRLPSGLMHFVVVWRVAGRFVQVMDPARGRRWIPRAAFLRDVYVHTLAVPEEAVGDWLGSDGFKQPLGRRLDALGISDGSVLLARASAGPGWTGLAALDAATRTVAALVAAGDLPRGAEARRLIVALAAAGAGGSAGAPSIYATAEASASAGDGTPQVRIRGAVLLRVSGAIARDDSQRAALPAELRAAIEAPRARPAAALTGELAADGLWRWGALAAGTAALALGAVAEALLFRTLIDLPSGRSGGSVGRLLGAGGVFGAGLILLGLLLAVELPLARGLRGGGTRMEVGLRRLFLRKIPRLPDRYFQTRPVSDLAERAHVLHRLRALPTLGADIVRTALEILVVGAALVWLDPGGAALAGGLVVAMLAIPFAAEPLVAERDLRMRNHAGALGRFYLDGLLGLIAARTHGAGPALVREHRDRLAEWRRAARMALVAALSAEAVQSLVGFGLAVALLVRFFAKAPGAADPGTALLVVYWALCLPGLGQELGRLVQQIPAQRNLTLRLLEPLGAPEDQLDDTTAVGDAAVADDDAADDAAVATRAAADLASGASVAFEDVRVVAAGHQILELPALSIAPGEHLAIVGASGAGKSSLVGLLLGWYRPATGVVRVDGAPLDGARLAELRRHTVWVDPSVYLWNRSLAANLAFGLADAPEGLAAALDDAELGEIVDRLPRGMATPLGEAGGLVSGGEGQRVRFGRGLLRPAPRLLILDEPFRGLSRDRRAALLARARRRWSAATLLCITHDIAETASFPRVLVIAGGRVVEDGTPAALLAEPGSRYAALAEAEQRVQAAAWSGPGWRRFRLARGRVEETAP